MKTFNEKFSKLFENESSPVMTMKNVTLNVKLDAIGNLTIRNPGIDIKVKTKLIYPTKFVGSGADMKAVKYTRLNPRTDSGTMTYDGKNYRVISLEVPGNDAGGKYYGKEFRVKTTNLYFKFVGDFRKLEELFETKNAGTITLEADSVSATKR